MSIVQNKKLHLNYTVFDSFEAGLKLTGNEVKAVRGSAAEIEGAKIIIRGGEAFLVGIYISPYQNHDKLNNENKKTKNQTRSDKTKKLLLKKNEILKLATLVEKGFHLLVEKIIEKHGLLKLQIAVCKRKNKADKREIIRKRDLKRDF